METPETYTGSSVAGSSVLPAQPLPEIDDGISRQLANIWRQILGVESVGMHDNYFDLGGDSSLAVQMFARVEQAFQVKLPLATLYDAPTVAELARFVRGELAGNGWSPLVPIQTRGSRPPFFCMHPHGGNVLIYRDLSKYLGGDQPFYGLQCLGMDGTCAPLERIEDMAALYVKEVRKVQPRGPYFLGGYCMGGTLAYEMAQQLLADGQAIALVAMFDPIEWSRLHLPSFPEKAYYNGERVLFHLQNVWFLPAAERGKFLKDKLTTLRVRIKVRFNSWFKESRISPSSDVESEILGKIWNANFWACANYRPQPYLGSITEFRPTKQYRAFNRPEARWDDLAKGGQEILMLPVNPPAMLADPFVSHLAIALRNSINLAMQRNKDSIRQAGFEIS